MNRPGPPLKVFNKTRLNSISTLARSWGIADWDVILVGDGSGSGWHLPAGWGCTLIERSGGKRQRFYGGMNLATIAIAEMMPYVHAMAWYAEHRKRAGAKGAICKVYVITDHRAIVDEGQALAHGEKSLIDVSNRAFWSALLSFERDGFVLDYRWVERATIALNCHADEVSKAVFRAMKTIPLPTAANGEILSSYECNANDEHRTMVHDLVPDDSARSRRKRGQKPHPDEPEGEDDDDDDL